MASNTPNNSPLPTATPVTTESSSDQPTVIIVVVISFGCLFVLGSLLLCVWCIFKRHCKKWKLVHERKDVDVDEHLKVQELVLPGPHGPKTMVLSDKDEVHVHMDVHKDEINMVGKGMHIVPRETGAASSLDDGVGSSQQLTHPEHQV